MVNLFKVLRLKSWFLAILAVLIFGEANATAQTIGSERDYVAETQEACDRGQPKSCTILGFMLTAEGWLEAEPDYDRAFALFKKGCQTGDPNGCSNLGVMYANGITVAQDFAQAAKLYQQGCEGLDTIGCAHLGYLYETGRGVETDFVQAHLLYTDACVNKFKDACERWLVGFRESLP